MTRRIVGRLGRAGLIAFVAVLSASGLWAQVALLGVPLIEVEASSAHFNFDADVSTTAPARLDLDLSAPSLLAIPDVEAAVAPLAHDLATIAVPATADRAVYFAARARLDDDLTAMRAFRSGYAFWRNVFMIPDGSIAFGSGLDGRLLATFPERGEWEGAGKWEDPTLANLLYGSRLPSPVEERRETVASLLEPVAGRIVHNPTRGTFLMPNLRRYGSFVEDWGAIYERFGVPAEIGLAQAAIESGFDGRIRSEAGALGFCQWMPANWERLKRLSPSVIEGYNQTTQAPYCAAYLSILATKYGSFIPALSEHHAGGTNVARVVITGERLGGQDVRERYFLGSELVRDLRDMSPRTFSDVYGTYGPRSYRYAEMIFGNTLTILDAAATTPQQRIYAMRTSRAVPISEIIRRTGLSAAEVKRFNPALVNQVPARANLYLPAFVAGFGTDVSFWHRPPSAAYAQVLADFLGLGATLEEWHNPSFRRTLTEFQRRFEATDSEEGRIMAATLAYSMDELYSGPRLRILEEYEDDPRISSLIHLGAAQRDALRALGGGAR